MLSLVELPPEILHGILSFTSPIDLSVTPQTCRFLYYYIKGNGALCRDVYYNTFDEPPASELDWLKEIRDIVRLETICTRHDINKKAHLSFVTDTVSHLLQNATGRGGRTSGDVTYADSLNVAYLKQLFDAEVNRDVFFSGSFIFERAKLPEEPFSVPPKPAHQQSAKLHCLYGVPRLTSGSGRTRSSTAKMYPFACSKVYDLRQYTTASRWGPFMGDGSDRVDWEKVEAITIVLRHNIRRRKLDRIPSLTHFWNTPFAGSWPGSYRRQHQAIPLVREPSSLEMMDPYDVSGTWVRIVCFLDYGDFHRYNFPIDDHELPANVPRAARNFSEATRLIIMKVRVTKIEPPGPQDGQDLPVVHFRGQSKSLETAWDQDANSELRGEPNSYGSVRLTREGEVRWTTFTVYHGHARWRSEGVQIGGVRSARGVVGNWFDKDYDPHGPCGPNAFWKIGDLNEKGDDRSVGQTDFLHLVEYADDINVDGADWTSEDEDEDEDWDVDVDPDEEGASEMELDIEGIEVEADTDAEADDGTDTDADAFEAGA